MKVLGVIPSRYESSRFPGKPLIDINGKPMIWWVYNQAIKVKEFEDVYVATDDERILSVCHQYDMKVLLTSKQHKTGTDRLGEVAKQYVADFYVNIQGDEPLIEPDTVSKVIQCYKEHPEYNIINTMTLLSPEEDVMCNTIVKVVVAEDGRCIYLSRSPVPYPKNGQKISYYKHLGLYGLTRDALLFFASSARGRIESIEDVEMMRFIEKGYRIQMVKTDSATIGVDSPADAERVRQKMRRYAR